MIFHDRIEAAELLAQALVKWRGRNPLIVAIPRGAAVQLRRGHRIARHTLAMFIG